MEEAGKIVLARNGQNKNEAPNKKNITFQKLKICLTDTLRRSETLKPPLKSIKSTIPDKTRPLPPEIVRINGPKHQF